MSYNNFLAIITENTNHQFEDYKWLCRFCLKKSDGILDGIDLIPESKNNYNTGQRETLFNNYHIITKKYLPASPEYPNFVCSSCELQLSHNANFIRQIDENAENWEMFLKRGNYVHVEMKHDPMSLIEVDEIKIEKCEEDNFVNVPGASVYDVFDLSTANDEKPIAMVQIHTEPPMPRYQGIVNDDAVVSNRKRRRVDKSEPKHVTRTTEYERTCKLCNEPTFSSMGRYYDHQRQNHPGEKSFTCDVCGTKFTEKYQVYTHMKDRHSKSGKKHQCQFCAKLFFSDREMKGHEKLHLNNRSYICPLCGKGFNGKSNLNNHLKSKIHGGQRKTYSKKKDSSYKPTTYRCEYCRPPMMFSSAEERAEHKNVMHKTFECDVCKSSFMAQESLDSHKLRHSNKPRKHVCSVCNATFNQSSHLTSHYKRKHTTDKSFQCSHCDKRFVDSCDVSAHVNLVHSKKDRVKCQECPSNFAAERYLQRHILHKHSTDASPYDCNICGKRYPDGSKLDLHRLKCH